MERNDFTIAFETLCQRFGKPPKHELANVYFQRCQRIPGRLFSPIVDEIIDNFKNFPTPQEIKNEYFRYLDDHPEKKAKKQITPCDYCNGLGWLEYLATEPGHNFFDYKNGKLVAAKYARVARCGYCNNWQAQGVPAHFPLWTVENIESRGLELSGSTKYRTETIRSDKKIQLKSLNTCVSMTAKKMPKVNIDSRVYDLRKQAATLRNQDEIPF